MKRFLAALLAASLAAAPALADRVANGDNYTHTDAFKAAIETGTTIECDARLRQLRDDGTMLMEGLTAGGNFALFVVTYDGTFPYAPGERCHMTATASAPYDSSINITATAFTDALHPITTWDMDLIDLDAVAPSIMVGDILTCSSAIVTDIEETYYPETNHHVYSATIDMAGRTVHWSSYDKVLYRNDVVKISAPITLLAKRPNGYTFAIDEDAAVVELLQ